MWEKKRFSPKLVRPSVAKRGQVTVFVIIAIVIVAAAAIYFLITGGIFQTQIPASLLPAYTSFLTCLEDNTLTGATILGSQGGYIDKPVYEAGSSYLPFGSQLNFLGSSIPYWYYVSGNGIQKEQVPSRTEMEQHLGNYVERRIRDCELQTYYDQGFVISMEEPSADVRINDDNIEVDLRMEMTLEKESDTAIVRNHNKVINSQLGSLYNSALRVYDYEQETLFLENYTIDALRLYAPVDGLEISCSPMVWGADKVFDDIQNALEQNINVLGSNLEEGYYKVNAPVSSDTEVRFLTSKTWPYNLEVAPSDGNVLIAIPVGNQPGLGILGFCYVPYHFVYNVKYPIVVQLQKGEEIFQFPVAVVVEGNKPREALEGTGLQVGIPELCQSKNTLVNVNVYNTNLNPVDAEIFFRCFGEICSIGDTSSGQLQENFPQCANGYVVAKADGYKEGNILYSTTESGSVNIFLEKLYTLNVNLRLDGQSYNGNALISFVAEDSSSVTVPYPEQRQVELSQGEYEVQVYVYRNSSIQLQESTTRKCLDIPDTGIGGVFGLTREKCFDIVVPAQIISSALAGGGKQSYYVLESDLIGSTMVDIRAESLPTPNSIEQIQNNYALFEEKNLGISFR
ncbi:MAG: hypothetical protein WD876_02985 [Candidatus Pacearchaeota archaeon]